MSERRKCLGMLGLSEGATEDEIKKAYRRLALQYHPDKNSSDGAKGKFQEIGYAYKYLTEGPSAFPDNSHNIREEMLHKMFAEMFFFMNGCNQFGGFFYDVDSDRECYFSDSSDDGYYGYHEAWRNSRNYQDSYRNSPPPFQPFPNLSKKAQRKREKRQRQRERENEKKKEQKEHRQWQNRASNSDPYSADINATPPKTKVQAEESAPTPKTEGKPKPTTPVQTQTQPQKINKKQKKKLESEQRKREAEMKEIAADFLKKQERDREKQLEKERQAAEQRKEEEKENEEFPAYYDFGKKSRKARQREKKRQLAEEQAQKFAPVNPEPRSRRNSDCSTTTTLVQDRNRNNSGKIDKGKSPISKPVQPARVTVPGRTTNRFDALNEFEDVLPNRAVNGTSQNLSKGTGKNESQLRHSISGFQQSNQTGSQPLGPGSGSQQFQQTGSLFTGPSVFQPLDHTNGFLPFQSTGTNIPSAPASGSSKLKCGYKDIARNSADATEIWQSGLSANMFEGCNIHRNSSSSSIGSKTSGNEKFAPRNSSGSTSSFDDSFGNKHEFVKDLSQCSVNQSDVGSEVTNDSLSDIEDEKIGNDNDSYDDLVYSGQRTITNSKYRNAPAGRRVTQLRQNQHSGLSGGPENPRNNYPGTNVPQKVQSDPGLNKAPFQGPRQQNFPYRGPRPHVGENMQPGLGGIHPAEMSNSPYRQPFRFTRGGFAVAKHGNRGSPNAAYQNQTASHPRTSDKGSQHESNKNAPKLKSSNPKKQQSGKANIVQSKPDGGAKSRQKSVPNGPKLPEPGVGESIRGVQYSRGGTLEEIESRFRFPDHQNISSQPHNGATVGNIHNNPNIFSSVNSEKKSDSLDSLDDLSLYSDTGYAMSGANLNENAQDCASGKYGRKISLDELLSMDKLSVPANMFTDSMKNYYS